MKKLNHVLLVEDDIATVFLHQMLLEEMELVEHIDVAYNGQEGLNYIMTCDQADLPELILLDINMPFLDGFEFLEQYEKLDEERKTGITLMMVTTSSNPNDLDRAKNFYPILKGLLEKPLTEEAVKGIWEQYFNS